MAFFGLVVTCMYIATPSLWDDGESVDSLNSAGPASRFVHSALTAGFAARRKADNETLSSPATMRHVSCGLAVTHGLLPVDRVLGGAVLVG
jgi:hypothetical protein